MFSFKSVANDFEKYLDNQVKKGKFNGVVLIVKNDSIVVKKAYGINFPYSDSLDLNAQFRIASVSKTFTSMAIMMLKEDGKLNYDQTVEEFLPHFPYKGITIRQLMNHTSGLPDYFSLMEEHYQLDLKHDDPKKLISDQSTVMEFLIEQKPACYFNPGERFQYSNTGYVVLALIVEKISGVDFPSYLERNIFKPFKMDATSVYKFIPGVDSTMPYRAYGFKQDKKGNKIWNDTHFLNGVYGDGGIYSTAEDLLKWDKALYTDSLVKQSTLFEAFTQTVEMPFPKGHRYGLGWEIHQWDENDRIVEHGGSHVGFKACLLRDVKNKNTIIVLSNNTLDNPRKFVLQLQKLLEN